MIQQAPGLRSLLSAALGRSEDLEGILRLSNFQEFAAWQRRIFSTMQTEWQWVVASKISTAHQQQEEPRLSRLLQDLLEL